MAFGRPRQPNDPSIMASVEAAVSTVSRPGLLGRLWHEHGLTLVIVTHDTSVAHRARTAGLMRDGRLEVRSGATPGHPAPDGAPAQGVA